MTNMENEYPELIVISTVENRRNDLSKYCVAFTPRQLKAKEDISSSTGIDQLKEIPISMVIAIEFSRKFRNVKNITRK